jgi:hypothetical protein
MGADVFQFVTVTNINLFVPAAAFAAYRGATGWSGFTNTVGVMDNKPTAAADLVYTGDEQTGVEENTTYYTITDGSATNAGSYTAVVSLNDGYVWEDSTDGDLEFDWEIAKATPAAVVFPTAEGITYDPDITLADILLEDDGEGDGAFAWEDLTLVPTVSNSGYNVVFTPNDADNYDYTGVEFTEVVALAVAKAGGTFAPTAAVNTTYTTTLTLASLTLPDNYVWNTGTTALSAGSAQTFPATYTDPSGNYEAAEGNITVNVAKATPTYIAPTGLTATAGKTLADVLLSGGWSWMDATTLVGAVGTQTHKAKYTPTDVANYNVLENIDVSVEVKAATPIYDIKKSNNLYGIMLRSSIVSDKMEIVSITLPNDNFKEAKVVIYDNVGNVVKELKAGAGGKAYWNLTNGADRSVANGSYLLVAEVKGAKGSYMYSAKVGVRR